MYDISNFKKYRLFQLAAAGMTKVMKKNRQLLDNLPNFMAPELKNAFRLTETLETINSRWPQEYFAESEDNQTPVFIFSAGWGSGSTLLQRLVLSSNETVIWGEALGEAGVLLRLTAAMSTIRKDWPPDIFFSTTDNIEELHNQWVANLTPPIIHFRNAQRKMLLEWFAKPAEDYGVKQWGFKEIRLTIDHARYLRWLFPKAKFLFLYRNVYDCYQSYKGSKWYTVWPHSHCKTPFDFANHWKLLLQGYLEGYKEVDGRLIKYEDLIAGKIDLAELAKYLGLSNIDESVMKEKIGSRGKKRKKITFFDRFVLRTISGSLLKKAGYNH